MPSGLKTVEAAKTQKEPWVLELVFVVLNFCTIDNCDLVDLVYTTIPSLCRSSSYIITEC